MLLDAPFSAAANTSGVPWRVLAFALSLPLPLAPLQALLERLVSGIAGQRPELFARLGAHVDKCFVVDPTDVALVLVLHPHPRHPRLRAVSRRDAPAGDARIAAPLALLGAVAGGQADSDALFFTRELVITGDTEAAVCLRYALDDLDRPLADDILAVCGPPGRAIARLLSHLGRHAEPR